LADVVITSLMDDASVASATDGPAGILAGLRPGGIHLCATTISPGQAVSLAASHSARGTSYLAGPVIGRPGAAAMGQLITLTSGPDEAVERCCAVIATYAARIIKLGPQPGLANTAKLLTNYVAYASLELIGQVCAYAERAELPDEFSREMLAGMFAPALRQYIDRVAGRQYDDVEFDTYGGLKDLDLIAEATTAAATPLAYAGIIRDRLLAAIANGFGDQDMCAIAEIARGLAGLGWARKAAS
jgi:3-hydroxyisobutyrate dehydrogenase-like beta-hydroxyacid dehydrogenase